MKTHTLLTPLNMYLRDGIIPKEEAIDQVMKSVD